MIISHSHGYILVKTGKMDGTSLEFPHREEAALRRSLRLFLKKTRRFIKYGRKESQNYIQEIGNICIFWAEKVKVVLGEEV